MLVFPGLILAKGIDLYSMFPNMTLGVDPMGADSAYAVCAGQTANTLDVEVWVGTDNSDPNDALQGLSLEMLITADQPGVTLDTTVSTVYNGSAVQNWDDSILLVGVWSGGGDPSVFPLSLKVGGADVSLPINALGAGDHLIATLRFNISSPTNISVNGTTISDGPALLVTTLANGYDAAFLGTACGPTVPTLSEWGLIIFAVALLVGMVWYLRRRSPATVTA
jgi:hypothetical protein